MLFNRNILKSVLSKQILLLILALLFYQCEKVPESIGNSTIKVPGDHLTIQSAIDAASDGDTILIADGVYSGRGNYDLSWDASSKHLVIISENGPANCIIDCKRKGRGFRFFRHNRYDIISGLTITNGLCVSSPPSTVGGGAIIIRSARPQIINCILENNIAGFSESTNIESYFADGGAIDCVNASPIIKGNIIRNNFSSHTGGAIHFADESSGVVQNNIIENNECFGCYGGGGIALLYKSNPLIINNLIINNRAGYYETGGFGGGIITMNSNPRIINNTIANNTTRTNSLLGEGGGIRVRGKPYPIIMNCIIWKNEAGTTFENIDFQYPSEILKISYCNVEGGLHGINATDDSTNLNSMPQFIDPGNNNYQLAKNSPCINRGNPDTTGLQLPSHDLSDNNRIAGDTIDLGAYEYNLNN